MKFQASCNSCKSNIRIKERRAKSFDLARLRTFLGTALSKGFMNKELRHTTLLVANGQIIASFSAVPLSPSVVYFSTLKVAKPFRRKGLAENLMRQAIESMREKGFVCGYAVTLSKKSEALVQKLGTGRIPREEMPRGVPLHLLDGKNGKKYQYWLFSFLKN